jgi:CDGSH-type Zn-finger protein/truncated hemoglobin YjbI
MSFEQSRDIISSADIREVLGVARMALIASGDGVTGDVAIRLSDSVIRPLAALLGDADTLEYTEDQTRVTVADPDIWALAQYATSLCLAKRCPPPYLEAVAALQDLAIKAEGSHAVDRIARLRGIAAGLPSAIYVSPNGPLVAVNVDDLHDWLGRPLPTRPITALCRCGRSKLKPYCDGSHAQGFDDTKDTSRLPDRRDEYAGQQIGIIDNRGTCQHSGFCTDRLATVFRVKDDPFIAPSGGRMDEIMRAVRDCPSGALSYTIDGIEARAEVDHHGKRAASIEVSKDGPYRVTGSIALLDAQGGPIARNAGASREHYTLCRCGSAQNKPFCTGMHWNVEFRDPVPPPDHEPTIFEWAGGLPALTRMMRLFYEKFIPADAVLAPVFANMSIDHPQRVASWLAEVFCGPKNYSTHYGGYTRMISEHAGKCITEEMRSRWVALLLQSAKEAGLPNDPEFRAAFQSYIEWGSRLAVENSQTESRPPQTMPMPKWDWTTSAGPPGCRVSALATPTESAPIPPTIPSSDEPVRFGIHIKPLFRERDRKSMKFAFDLWSHADVSKHAEEILVRVRNGTMPCDGAWPPEYVDTFARWVSEAKRE